MRHLFWASLACLALGAQGCAKVKALVCEPVEGQSQEAKKSDDGGDAAVADPEHPKAPVAKPSGAHAGQEDDGDEDEKDDAPSGFPLPFAHEQAPDEPLARTRAFLREATSDNSLHMRKDVALAKSLLEAQTPRATVLTCADSKIQNAAFDATSENDDFTVRNLGPQVGKAKGSVEFGVEKLNTPLLLVLGHTGCEAVKAAMMDTAELSGSLKSDLEGLQVAKADANAEPTPEAWLGAVVSNVHAQVDAALTLFGTRVSSGSLTIVGAVYDPRNDLHKGYGKLTILNVNGVRDAARVSAFERAVLTPVQLAETANQNGNLAESAAETRRLVNLALFQAQQELKNGPATRAHRHHATADAPAKAEPAPAKAEKPAAAAPDKGGVPQAERPKGKKGKAERPALAQAEKPKK